MLSYSQSHALIANITKFFPPSEIPLAVERRRTIIERQIEIGRPVRPVELRPQNLLRRPLRRELHVDGRGVLELLRPPLIRPHVRVEGVVGEPPHGVERGLGEDGDAAARGGVEAGRVDDGI